MTWFIVYLAYHACSGFTPVNCVPGTHYETVKLPSQAICEDIVKLNPTSGLECWAKPDRAAGKASVDRGVIDGGTGLLFFPNNNIGLSR